MTATFWWLVTSEWMQAIAAGLALASMIVAVVGRWVPGIKVYAGVARVVSYVALLVLGLGIGFRSADESAALRQTRTDLAFTRLQLETQRQTADVAKKLRTDALAEAAAANEKVTDYETWLQDRPAGCGCAFDDDDVKRLRDIAR
ncbi:MAG: hypothetical protein J0H32_01645 [Rhizobiales bacterium]|nr:hypothetical protein [Hyphomicrobiales bacterium]MBN8983180.1 hypothetical protein [Hyphomicrobiales bacterium]MBN9001511.1 hypothetical protein [Hyphomicrobiales bacterium]